MIIRHIFELEYEFRCELKLEKFVLNRDGFSGGCGTPQENPYSKKIHCLDHVFEQSAKNFVRFLAIKILQ